MDRTGYVSLTDGTPPPSATVQGYLSGTSTTAGTGSYNSSTGKWTVTGLTAGVRYKITVTYGSQVLVYESDVVPVHIFGLDNLDTSVVATVATAQTLTNKTINASQLVNESVTAGKIDAWPKVGVGLSGTKTITAPAGATAISWDGVNFEHTDNLWDAGAPTRVTITTAGVYRVAGMVSADPMEQVLSLAVRQNGTDNLLTLSRPVGVTGTFQLSFTRLLNLSASYLELCVDPAASTNITVGSNSYWDVEWVGPAS